MYVMYEEAEWVAQMALFDTFQNVDKVVKFTK